MSLVSRHLPYAKRKGLRAFPNGAGLAVLIYNALEEWDWDRSYSAEYRPVSDYPTASAMTRPDEAMRSAVSYGFTVGVPRFADVLAEFEVKSTFLTGGLAAESWPQVVRELMDDGHELTAHSYDQGIRLGQLDRAGQEAVFERTLRALEAVTGTRPSGWVGPAAAATVDTVELVAENGLSYHGDLQGDELPYFVDVAGRTIVEIPYRMIGNINDKFLFARPQRTPDEAFDYLLGTFRAYHETSAQVPLIFTLGLHPYLIGRPEAASVLRRWLREVVGHAGVWITTYSDLARWWMDEYGQDGSFEPVQGR